MMFRVCQILGLLVILLIPILGISVYYDLRGRKRKYSLSFWSKKHVSLIILYIVCFGVMPRIIISSMILPGDEGVYMLAALKMHSGQKLYSEILISHPPAGFVITNILFKYFGVGVALTKTPTLLFSLLTIPLIYFISKKFWGAKHALFVTLMYSTSNTILYFTSSYLMYSELIFFSLLASFFLVEGLETKQRTYAFIAGVMMAAATLYRMFGLYIVFISLVFLFTRGKKQKKKFLTSYILGFLLVSLPITLYFHQAAPENFLYLLFSYHKDIVSQQPLSLPERIYNWAKNFGNHPILMFIIFSLIYTDKRKQLIQLTNADYYYCLWASGFLFMPLIPAHMPALSLMYSTYFITPLFLLSGRLIVAIQHSPVRTLIVCILLLQIMVVYASIVQSTLFDTSLKKMAEYIQSISNPGETITGSIDALPQLSFLTNLSKTGDVLNPLNDAKQINNCPSLEGKGCFDKITRLLSESEYIVYYMIHPRAVTDIWAQFKEDDCVKTEYGGILVLYDCSGD